MFLLLDAGRVGLELTSRVHRVLRRETGPGFGFLGPFGTYERFPETANSDDIPPRIGRRTEVKWYGQRERSGTRGFYPSGWQID
ncbi:hypothetical protein C9J85_03850 [Haloferax sp. wsp5]|nr:hypothetical protein C9J85_03850 [Haloferax sp. wsp5]